MNTTTLKPTNTKPYVKWIARLGYFSKGVVYLIVGWIAVEAAWEAGDQTVGSKGAIAKILEQPHGKALLILLIVGLICYVVWRLIQVFQDPDNKGSDMKGIAIRAGYCISGLLHVSLALYAINLLVNIGGSSSGQQDTQSMTAKVMAEPYGRWLIGILGAAIILFAFYQFYYAYSQKFKNHIKLSSMSPTERTWTIRSGMAGYTARAVVFIIIGWFFIQAATQYDAQEAGGLNKALQEILQNPYGPWLLTIVALGLIGYGIFCFIEGVYRRIGIT